MGFPTCVIQKLIGSGKPSDGLKLQFMIDAFEVVEFTIIHLMSSVLFEDPGVKKMKKVKCSGL
jgi:hypothetical protein